MPSPKSHRKYLGHDEKNKKGRLSEKASSFHGGVVAEEMLPRPRTVPDLVAAWRRNDYEYGEVPPPKLTKLLIKVTIQRSVGAVHLLIAPEATVEDLIASALRQYAKEARRPVLMSSGHPSDFDLHFSQFSLQSLDRKEKVMELGSRNFFLCPNKSETQSSGALTSSYCSKEADDNKVFPWLKFMQFLL